MQRPSLIKTITSRYIRFRRGGGEGGPILTRFSPSLRCKCRTGGFHRPEPSRMKALGEICSAQFSASPSFPGLSSLLHVRMNKIDCIKTVLETLCLSTGFAYAEVWHRRTARSHYMFERQYKNLQIRRKSFSDDLPTLPLRPRFDFIIFIEITMGVQTWRQGGFEKHYADTQAAKICGITVLSLEFWHKLLGI